MRKRTIALLGALGVSAAAVAMVTCGPPARVRAPRPEVVIDSAPAADSAPSLPPTYASAPVSLDLRLLMDEIERTIPRRIGSLDARVLVSAYKPRAWLALEVERGPLDIEFGRGSMTMATTLTYRGRVWVKVPLTTVSASCGTTNAAPRVRVRIRTDYELDAAWRVHTRSRVLDVAPASGDDRDKCHVTFVKVDVTDRVVAAARDEMQKALATVDAQIARLDVRGAVTPAWRALQQPIALQDTTLWLTLRPRAVGVGPVTVRDSTARALVTVLAEPRIRSGPRPPGDSLPLPNLTRLEGRDTLVTALDGSLDYGTANRLLRAELRGRRLRIRGRRVVVENLGMSYLGRGRITLGVQLSGAVEGRVWFVGTPRYDPETDAVVVPDLDYDARSLGMLAQGVQWLAGTKLRDALRREARLPARALLDFVRSEANRELDSLPLAPGVHLSGSLGPARALDVRATATGLQARARGGGRLALDIRAERVFADLHIPRQPIRGVAEREPGGRAPAEKRGLPERRVATAR